MSTIDARKLVVLCEPEIHNYVQKFTRQPAVDDVVGRTVAVAEERLQERGNLRDLLGLVYGIAREIVLSEDLYIRLPAQAL